MYGSEEFRSAEWYGELDGDTLSRAVDRDIDAALESLREEHPEVDPAQLMEDFAVTAFGGDLRDSIAWNNAAREGDLPEAWERAVEKQLSDE